MTTETTVRCEICEEDVASDDLHEHTVKHINDGAGADAAPQDDEAPSEPELIFGFDPFMAYTVRIPGPQGHEFSDERCGVPFNRGEAKLVAMSIEASEEAMQDRCRRLKEFRHLGYDIFEGDDAPERELPEMPLAPAFDPTSDGAE